MVKFKGIYKGKKLIVEYEDLGLIDGYFVSKWVIDSENFENKVLASEVVQVKGVEDGARHRFNLDYAYQESIGLKITGIVI